MLKMSTCFAIVVQLMLLWFAVPTGLAQYEPQVIGTSNLPTATAFNNSRKIVRDSSDVVHVFYHDEVDGRPVIWTTHALHGVDWSEPEIFAYGSYPAVVISPDEMIYVAYMDENGGIMINATNGKNISKKISNKGYFPSIASNQNSIFVVFQYDWKPDSYGSLSIAEFSKDLERISGSTINQFPSKDASIVIRPMISGDVKFNNVEYGVVWMDSIITTHDTRVNLYYSNDWYHRPLCISDSLDSNYQIINPSISMDRDNIHVTGADNLNSGLINFYCYYDDYEGQYSYCNWSYYDTQTTPWVCSDDTYIPNCAIIWQDGDQIFYNQESESFFDYREPINLYNSEKTIYYPSVGYKLYRAYSFDTIWAVGDAPPYDIMYVRARKSRFSHYMNHECWPYRAEKITYKKECEYVRFSFWGGEGKISFSIINADSGLGKITTSVSDDGFMYYVRGVPTISGDFKLKVRFTDSDYPPNNFDYTVTLSVINSSPVFNSSEMVQTTQTNVFEYIASAIDYDGNHVSYNFENYPSWASPQDSVLSGTVPANAIDTTFTIIASDGELSDTLTVQIIIDQDPLAVENDAVPNAFKLYPNNPNPFNPVTRIVFDLPVTAHVDLGVYNMRGQRVATLVDGARAAGQHSVNWNAGSHASGVYWYRIQAGKYTAVQKMVLVK